MDTNTIIFIITVIVFMIFLLWQEKKRNSEGKDKSIEQLVSMTDGLNKAQIELSGRLSQMAEGQAASQNHLAERMQVQERMLTKTLEEKLTEVTKRVGLGLEATSEKNAKTMNDLRERLATISEAQKEIAKLSGQVVKLQDVLSNRQARGAFGEIQLQDLVSTILPPSVYNFQALMSNGKQADCLLSLPNPPGAIAIDAKFPLEAYHALRAARDDTEIKTARRQFRDDVLKHVKDISEKYIIPGETAESALMFLPSEAVYAELHATFQDVVEKSYRAKVWIVSPTTLMATLNTIRAVLKDARMREQAGVIQKEVGVLLKDVDRLDKRVDNLSKHFNLAQRDVDEIRTSSGKIVSRSQKIEDIEIGEEDKAIEEKDIKVSLLSDS